VSIVLLGVFNVISSHKPGVPMYVLASSPVPTVTLSPLNDTGSLPIQLSPLFSAQMFYQQHHLHLHAIQDRLLQFLQEL
jgi:hypothetical protein